MYSDKLLDHFLNPRNVGDLPDADGVGTMGSLECGDYLEIGIKVTGGKIADIRFKAYGCPAAIATTSATTELALNKTLDEAWAITDSDVMVSLGGLPDPKIHCSLLGPAALKKAIEDYKIKENSK
ncbi:MAG: iron-sulfur cluster assembly scaffold protein [bacterium]|jgi:nitrogen fixation NifU-like protein